MRIQNGLQLLPKEMLSVLLLSECEKRDRRERHQNVRRVKRCKTVVRGELDS